MSTKEGDHKTVFLNKRLIVLFALLLILPSVNGCNVHISYPLSVATYISNFGSQEGFAFNLIVLPLNILILGALCLLFSRLVHPLDHDRVRNAINFVITYIVIMGIGAVVRLVVHPEIAELIIPTLSLGIGLVGLLFGQSLMQTATFHPLLYSVVYSVLLCLIALLGASVAKQRYLRNPVLWIVGFLVLGTIGFWSFMNFALTI